MFGYEFEPLFRHQNMLEWLRTKIRVSWKFGLRWISDVKNDVTGGDLLFFPWEVHGYH